MVLCKITSHLQRASLQVLSPRSDIGMYLTGKNKRRKIRDAYERDKDKENSQSIDLKEEEVRDPAAMVRKLDAVV